MIVQIEKARGGKQASVNLIAEGEDDRKSLGLLAEILQQQKQPRLYLDSHVITTKGVENLFLTTSK